MRRILTIALAAAAATWAQSCPSVFPSNLQLTLPRTLPPGSYPYVRDTAALWVFCDPAPAKGATAHISVPETSLLTLSRTLTKSSSVDATLFGRSDIFMAESPTVYVSAVSTDMHPAAGTQQYSLTIAIGGEANVVTVPVTVTFTDSPFVRASDASIGFDLPYPPGELDIESKAEVPAIWFPNSETPLAFTATSENWLSIAPASGMGWTVPVVRVAGDLKPGNYFGFVNIIAPGAVNSPLKIPANAILYAQQPSVSPSSLVFSQSSNGPAPGARTLTVSSPTASSFSASTDAAWLYVDPMQAGIPGAVSVSVKAAGLSPGTYAGRVTIRAEYSLAVSIPVTFVYGGSSDLHISPDSITLYHWPNISAVDAVDRGTFSITADRTMQWTATKSPETWFSLYNNGSFTPSQLVFTVPSWPAPGAYSGTITVSSHDAANSPQVVIVNAVVLDSAPLATDPTTLRFRAIGGDPEPQTVAVSAQSPTSFTVETTTNVGGPWLIVTPSAGQTPATLTVSIKTMGLGNGSYNGRLRFSIPQPGKPPAVMQMLIYMDYYVR